MMTQFEPFGESIACREQPAATPASRLMEWAGCTIFWLLAAAIVVARGVLVGADILPGGERMFALLRQFATFI